MDMHLGITLAWVLQITPGFDLLAIILGNCPLLPPRKPYISIYLAENPNGAP
jgi:hypothetical protein